MTDQISELGDGNPEERPAASSSPLADIRARRAEAVKQLHVDLLVPRYGIPLYVRYKPAPEHRVNAINKANEKSKDPERNIVANAAILADCCLGVFAVVQRDGQEVKVSVDDTDPDGEWPKFDSRLAEALGFPDITRASDVVRKLYLTDGDVLATATKLADWSGYSLTGVEEREGN